jgi:hypothetical protein
MLCPETMPTILAFASCTLHDNDIDDTCDAICLKNAKGVLVTFISDTAGGDTDLTITVHEGESAAEAAAGTHALTTGQEFPIWYVHDCATSDAFVRTTDAVTYDIDATGGHFKLTQIYISAAILTEGRPWVHVGTSGGHAANVTFIIYQLDGARYQQETPPTAIA